jgi:hypothetical protein
MDYTAGNPRGPHHQPTMFDTDQNNGWPPLPGQEAGRTEGRQLRWAFNHTCWYCEKKGHWNSECPTPHLVCPRKGKCVVPLLHQAFVGVCYLGGRTKADSPAKGRGKKRARTPTVPTNTPEATESPPAGSLLFSPNPTKAHWEEDDEMGRSFRQRSRYGGSTPPPSTWGNAPWGASWNDFSKRPPSPSFPKHNSPKPTDPCLVEYGRAGSQPLYLKHHSLEKTGVAEAPDTTMVEDFHPSGGRYNGWTPLDPLPADYGVEDLTTCAEEDLPGAVYYASDDPPLPTMAMVQAYRRKSVRDLGVSD